jgi:hypothetical protein
MSNQNPTPVTFLLKRTAVTYHAVTVVDDGTYEPADPIEDGEDPVLVRAYDLLDHSLHEYVNVAPVKPRPGESVKEAYGPGYTSGGDKIKVLGSIGYADE